MLKRLVKRMRKSEAGQAMVEMALVLPILLILVGGIIDFGWLFYNQLALTNAAREGARYAAIHYHISSDWKNESVTLMQSTYVGVNSASAQVFEPELSQIRATMTADVPILTGVASTILGDDSMTLTGTCVMRLEN